MKGKREKFGGNDKIEGAVGRKKFGFVGMVEAEGVGATQCLYIYNTFFVTLGS